MKKVSRFVVATVVILFLLSIPLSLQAVTTDLELVGDASGLLLAPENGKLFDLANMAPGEIRTAKITIRNNHTDWYGLWMQALDIVDESPGLFEVMGLTVLYGGEMLYSGPVEGFASGKRFLGRFGPGESGVMVMTVHLPGPETGNEYQGKSAGVKWLFTAQAGEEIVLPPEEPEVAPRRQPGELPRTYGAAAGCVLIGGLALLAGLRLARKR